MTGVQTCALPIYLLIIGATILWALENVIAKKTMLENKDTNYAVSFSRMFFGAIFLFGVAVLQNKIDLILALRMDQWFYIFVSSGLLFLYIYTYYYGLKFIKVSKAASLLLLAPVISLVIGATYFGEPVPPMQLLGSALILVGVYKVANIEGKQVRI